MTDDKNEWLSTDAGVAWHIDNLWRSNKPGEAVKVAAKLRAAAREAGEKAGYERGRAEWRSASEACPTCQGLLEHCNEWEAQVRELQSKYTTLEAAARAGHCTSGSCGSCGLCAALTPTSEPNT